MRVSRLLSVLLLLISFAPAWGHAPVVSPAVVPAHKAEHWIVTEDDQDAGGCTATAIAPHALLTAEHCDLKPFDEDGLPRDGSPVKLFVDRTGKPNYFEWTPYQIVGKLYDGSDHMILLVSGPAFKNIMPYGAPMAPYQGEHILWWGNPAGIRDQLREGYIMGSQQDQPVPFQKQGQQMWMADAPAIPGDSGSAIIDATDGHLVGIVTYGINDGEFVGFFTLHFTPGQLAVAENYGG